MSSGNGTAPSPTPPSPPGPMPPSQSGVVHAPLGAASSSEPHPATEALGASSTAAIEATPSAMRVAESTMFLA